MKSERLLSLFLFIAGLGMGGLGLASVLAYPEFLAWLLLVGGAICLLFAILIWVLPNDAAIVPVEDNGPNESQPRKGPRFLVPVCAAAAAVIVFAVAVSGGSGGSTREALAEIQAPTETAGAYTSVSAPDSSIPQKMNEAELNDGVYEQQENKDENTPFSSFGQSEETEAAEWRYSTYVINIDSNKFHFSTCRTLKNSDDSPNIIATEMTPDELIDAGYESCGVCNP